MSNAGIVSRMRLLESVRRRKDEARTLAESADAVSDGSFEIWYVYDNGEMFYSSQSRGFEHGNPRGVFYSEEEAKQAAAEMNAKRDRGESVNTNMNEAVSIDGPTMFGEFRLLVYGPKEDMEKVISELESVKKNKFGFISRIAAATPATDGSRWQVHLTLRDVDKESARRHLQDIVRRAGVEIAGVAQKEAKDPRWDLPFGYGDQEFMATLDKKGKRKIDVGVFDNDRFVVDAQIFAPDGVSAGEEVELLRDVQGLLEIYRRSWNPVFRHDAGMDPVVELKNIPNKTTGAGAAEIKEILSQNFDPAVHEARTSVMGLHDPVKKIESTSARIGFIEVYLKGLDADEAKKVKRAALYVPEIMVFGPSSGDEYLAKVVAENNQEALAFVRKAFDRAGVELGEVMTESRDLSNIDPKHRFYKKGNVIFDAFTDQRWLVGPDRDMYWHQAKEWSESLGDGWRLPTRAELIELKESNLYIEGWGAINPGWIWTGERAEPGSYWRFYYDDAQSEGTPMGWYRDTRAFAVHDPQRKPQTPQTESAENHRVEIKPGEEGEAVMPPSEVCMHMRVSGKKMKFRFLPGGKTVQLLNADGSVFSAPILYSEAGIYSQGDGKFYYYPDYDRAAAAMYESSGRSGVMRVVFRTERSGEFAGSVTAVFPDMDKRRGWFAIFTEDGEKTSGNWMWYGSTRAATPEEREKLMPRLKKTYPGAGFEVLEELPSDSVGQLKESVTDTGEKRIKTAYEIITPESAEEGDAEERGWEDEEGELIEPWDTEAGQTVVEAAIEWLSTRGPFEAPQSQFRPGAWYISYGGQDADGSYTNYSYHLEGFTPEEEQQIYDGLKAERLVESVSLDREGDPNLLPGEDYALEEGDQWELLDVVEEDGLRWSLGWVNDVPVYWRVFDADQEGPDLEKGFGFTVAKEGESVGSYVREGMEWVQEPDGPEEPDEDSITTEDGIHWYQYGKLYHTGDRKSLEAKMDKDQFWPSVYSVSDHGNAEPVTFKESKVDVNDFEEEEDFPEVEKMRRKKPKKSQIDKEKPARKTESTSEPKFIWRITKDHLAEAEPTVFKSTVGRSNTRDISKFDSLRKSRGIVKAFRLLDDDGELYYTGEMAMTDGSDPLMSDNIMDPLDRFGEGSGCTEIKVRKGSAWETV